MEEQFGQMKQANQKVQTYYNSFICQLLPLEKAILRINILMSGFIRKERLLADATNYILYKNSCNYLFSSLEMKSSNSFFPTNTHLKLAQSHQQHTYQVVKPNQNTITYRKSRAEPLNIFQDSFNPLRKQENKKQSFRPIGGKQLFRKMEQNSRQRSYDRKFTKRKTNKDFTQNVLLTSVSRFKKDEDAMEYLPIQSIGQSKEFLCSQEQFPEELLKAHAAYDPYSSVSKTRKTSFSRKSIKKSENASRPITSNEARHQGWSSKRRLQFQTKNAILNEISFNKPLVEVYGNRYFQYTLRNRYQEDIKPSPYVYLLSSAKSAESKTIAKLKLYRPEIKSKEMIVVKGRKLKTETYDLC